MSSSWGIFQKFSPPLLYGERGNGLDLGLGRIYVHAIVGRMKAAGGPKTARPLRHPLQWLLYMTA